MERQLEVFLKKLNESVNQKVQVAMLGGAVIVTLGLRNITFDLDVAVKSKYFEIIEKVLKELRKTEGINYQIFVDGNFSDLVLPDFWERATPIKTKYNNVELRFFHINDIILMKLDRGIGHDISDTDKLMKNVKDIDVNDLINRFKFMLEIHRGNEEAKGMFKLNFKSLCALNRIKYPLND